MECKRIKTIYTVKRNIYILNLPKKAKIQSFTLQNKAGKKFTVTRYLHPEYVGHVLYGPEQNDENKQPIELFHTTLGERLLTWIDDPIISQRIRATNYEINRMLINALAFPSLLEYADLCRRRCGEFEAFNKSVKMVFSLQKKHVDKHRIFLTQLFSTNATLLAKKIIKLREENPNALNFTNSANNYDKSVLFAYVDQLEHVQQQKFAKFAQTKEKALVIPSADDFVDLRELRDILKEFFTAHKKYTADMTADRKDDWNNEENNQMVAMRANLSDYFVEPAGVSAEDKAMCQRSIENAERDLKVAQQNAKKNLQEIYTQIRKMQRNIYEIADAMKVTVNELNTVTRQFLAEKLKR